MVKILSIFVAFLENMNFKGVSHFFEWLLDFSLQHAILRQMGGAIQMLTDFCNNPCTCFKFMVFFKQKVFLLLLPKSGVGGFPAFRSDGSDLWYVLECIEIALQCMWQYPYVLYVFQNLGSYTMYIYGILTPNFLCRKRQTL